VDVKGGYPWWSEVSGDVKFRDVLDSTKRVSEESVRCAGEEAFTLSRESESEVEETSG